MNNFCLVLLLSISGISARQYRGACVSNTLIDTFNVESLDQCKAKCRTDEECVAVTLNVELQTCQTFSFCELPMDSTRCPYCVTIKKEDFEPELCNVQGICEVKNTYQKYLSFLLASFQFQGTWLKTVNRNPLRCHETCKNDPECLYYTYDSASRCNLFSSCQFKEKENSTINAFTCPIRKCFLLTQSKYCCIFFCFFQH